MRTAVTTPNGNVGHHLTRMLVRAGIRPLLLTRHPEHLSESLWQYVDVACADSRDPDQVVAATRGVDAVYWVDPPTESTDPLTGYAQATEAIATAVTQNGIARVVFQSSVGAEKCHGVGEIDGLAATEVALDELDVDVTHLRCGYFFSNLLFDIESVRGGRLQTVLPLNAPMSWVAPRDIAEVAAMTLLNSSWKGRRVQAVHGPEDLSWSQVAEILKAELSRDVVVERVADTAMHQQYLALGMPTAMADAVLGMSAGLRDDFVPEQRRSVVTTTPTTLRTWVHDQLIPAGATEVVVADLNDVDALVDAAHGVDGVFGIIPAFAKNAAGIGVNMVEAAVRSGARKFVFSSVYHPTLTALSNHRDKQPAEAALYESGLDFTILQPAIFMQQLTGLWRAAKATGSIAQAYSADAKMAYVHFRDVAEVAVEAFVTDRFSRGTFELAAAGMYSRNDLAGQIGEALGRPIIAQSPSFETWADDVHLPAGLLRDGLKTMNEHYDQHGFPGGNSLVLTEMLGRPALTVPAFIQELARS